MTAALFEPITLRGLTVRNRSWVPPMCMFSVERRDGVPTDWHLIHYGSLARGGAGAVIVEATAVTAEGRISPWDLGLWNDDQGAAFRRIVDGIHAGGAAAGVQIAHAGRKASTPRDWDPVRSGSTSRADGGWNTVAPSAVAFGDLEAPDALTAAGIRGVIRDFAAGAARAIAAGFDFVEIHAAHGYLIHQFLAPTSNHRDDEYGGDLHSRARLLLEIVDAVRAAVPDNTPVLARLSATDWADEAGGSTIGETVEIVRLLREHGIDLVDVSTGGSVPSPTIPVGPGYQTPFATVIRNATAMPVGAVGLIDHPKQAEHILTTGQADVVLVGRQSLRDPNFPLHARRNCTSDSRTCACSIAPHGADWRTPICKNQNPDRSDMPHRAPHRRAFTSTTDPLIVTPTFVARVDDTPRAERPQDTGSSVDRHGREVQHPDANTDALALESNPNLSFEHWDEYWRKVHGPKFACDEPGSSSELILRYGQIHRIPGGPSSAWAPPYEAMVDQSDRLFDDPAARVPSYRRSRWDGLAYIVYRTKDDVTATLGQEKFDKRIIADEHTAFRKVTRGLTQEHIAIPSRLRREPISLVRILQRRPELSREEFKQRWLSEHSPLVLAQASTHIYVRRYAQLHTIGTVMDDPIAEAMDVIEIMGFSSVNDVEDYLTADGHHAISEHRETLAQPNAEFWTGISFLGRGARHRLNVREELVDRQPSVDPVVTCVRVAEDVVLEHRLAVAGLHGGCRFYGHDQTVRAARDESFSSCSPAPP